MFLINKQDYQSASAIRQVLGCLILNPLLLTGRNITKYDFPDSFHQTIFYAINGEYQLGATSLNAGIVNSYLKENYPSLYGIFKRHNGVKFVQDITNPKFINIENFEANYNELKKFSLFRELASSGIDTSDFFDPTELDAEINRKRREFLEENTVDDIVRFYKNKLNRISQKYCSQEGRDSAKAGSDRAKAQKELWKKAPSFGLGYCSQYLTTVTNGLREKKLSIYSAESGCGKTRVSIANLCYSFAARYWDISKQQFVDNPHGKNNAALYIGTEMELIEEIEPILWSYIAGVPTDHIILGQYEPGEEERVDEAIKILDEESHIYYEYIPSYDIATLDNTIDLYSTQFGVRHVFFDYIHITTDLIAEFQTRSKAHMTIREDQVLLNLGIKLKDLTRRYNVSIDAWTQVNGDAKNEGNRDATVIRGAKSLADKADICGILSVVTKKELKAVDRILKSGKMFGKPSPNRCFSVYKNRGGKYSKVKIWVYIDYPTMRVEDLFVTDYDYELLDIEKTYTGIIEDKVVSMTSRENFKKLLKQKKEALEIERDFMEEEGYENLYSEENEQKDDEIKEEKEEILDNLNDSKDLNSFSGNRPEEIDEENNSSPEDENIKEIEKPKKRRGRPPKIKEEISKDKIIENFPIEDKAQKPQKEKIINNFVAKKSKTDIMKNITCKPPKRKYSRGIRPTRKMKDD